MHQVPRPALPRISQRLAANNARVLGFLDQLEQRLDDLATATSEDDWNEVLRLSEFVAESSRASGYHRITEQARRVCELLQKPGEREQALQSLVRLIGMCGRVRMEDESAAKTASLLF
jgi:hypothetical protein